MPAPDVVAGHQRSAQRQRVTSTGASTAAAARGIHLPKWPAGSWRCFTATGVQRSKQVIHILQQEGRPFPAKAALATLQAVQLLLLLFWNRAALTCGRLLGQMPSASPGVYWMPESPRSTSTRTCRLSKAPHLLISTESLRHQHALPLSQHVNGCMWLCTSSERKKQPRRAKQVGQVNGFPTSCSRSRCPCPAGC